MATPTKYNLLEHIVNKSDEMNNDQAGNYHVIAGVVRIISGSYGSEEALSEEIYDYIASCFVSADGDDGKDAETPA